MKEKLLESMAAGRAREVELVALSVDVPANPDGRWNAKDHLAHLAWWRSRNATLLDAIRTGGELPPSVEDDPQNALIYAANRDRSAAEIKADAENSWDRFCAAIAAFSEADLEKPHPYSGFELSRTLRGSGHWHLGEHLMFWYLDHGDQAAAERAQIWVRDVDVDTAWTDRQRGVAEYNLACFYARTWQTDKAVPLLREGFELAPNLVVHARNDSDLDQIGADPRVVELLST